jgi:hypothetical protein
MSHTFNGLAVTDEELAICDSVGADRTQFAKMLADRRAGKPLVLAAAHTRVNENPPSGLIGPPIVDEALDEHRDELNGASSNHLHLVQEARKSIDQFLANSAAPDNWKILGRAAAMLTGALHV